MSRWVARVRAIANPTFHYEGFPSQSVERTDEDRRILLQEAAWIVMEENKDGVFLIRDTEEGEFAGDTWTPTRELALEVASSEYEITQDQWVAVPESAGNPIAFASDATSTS